MAKPAAIHITKALQIKQEGIKRVLQRIDIVFHIAPLDGVGARFACADTDNLN